MPTHVSVAMGNSILLEGLRRIFADADLLVTDAVSELEALDHTLIGVTDPHILVVDRQLLGEDGSTTIADLLERHPDLRIVVLTHAIDFNDMSRLYLAGAYAYFQDQVPYLSLVAMMQMVSIGQKVAPPEVISLLTLMPLESHMKPQSPLLESFNLTGRECSVLQCLGEGLPNKAISQELTVSESVVKATVKTILKKLSVRNRTQAAVLARELGAQLTTRTAQDAAENRTERPVHTGVRLDEDAGASPYSI